LIKAVECGVRQALQLALGGQFNAPLTEPFAGGVKQQFSGVRLVGGGFPQPSLQILLVLRRGRMPSGVLPDEKEVYPEGIASGSVKANGPEVDPEGRMAKKGAGGVKETSPAWNDNRKGKRILSGVTVYVNQYDVIKKLRY
jgi:hypothetical protein